MDSFMGWIGGKRALRNYIVSLFPSNFERYIEVFGGAGWVLFYKDKSKFEVFNVLLVSLVANMMFMKSFVKINFE